MVTKLNWVHFFTSPRWIPNPAEGNDPSFGALALIVGTFTTTFLGLVIAIPVGLGAAVYISEFAKGKVKETLRVTIELLAAIPSIVWGFIGLMVIGPIVKDIFTAPIQPIWGLITRSMSASYSAFSCCGSAADSFGKCRQKSACILAWTSVAVGWWRLFRTRPSRRPVRRFYRGHSAMPGAILCSRLHLAPSETGAGPGHKPPHRRSYSRAHERTPHRFAG
jgi:hypothetical protein